MKVLNLFTTWFNGLGTDWADFVVVASLISIYAAVIVVAAHVIIMFAYNTIGHRVFLSVIAVITASFVITAWVVVITQ